MTLGFTKWYLVLVTLHALRFLASGTTFSGHFKIKIRSEHCVVCSHSVSDVLSHDGDGAVDVHTAVRCPDARVARSSKGKGKASKGGKVLTNGVCGFRLGRGQACARAEDRIEVGGG